MIISVFALREGLTEAPWLFVLRKEAEHEDTGFELMIIFIRFSGLNVQLWICIAKSFVKIFGRGVFEPLHWGQVTT